MAEVTNRTLAILLVCAIMISLAGTVVSLGRLKNIYVPVTGFGTTDTSTGYVQYNVSINTQIEFDDNMIDFGRGYADGAACTMSVNASEENQNTSASAACKGQWDTFDNDAEYPLVIENFGNTDVNVSVTCNKGTNEFIGGTGDAFNWIAAQNETATCNETDFDGNIFYDWVAITANDETPLCPNMTWSTDGTKNSIALGIQVTIPQDPLYLGLNQTATITVLGTAITT